MLRYLVTALFFLCVVVSATNNDVAPSDVIELTDGNFDDIVMPDDKWLVAFTAPWCQFCQKMKSDWAATATALKGSVHVAEVDAVANPGLAQRFRINSFPTIYASYDGKMTAYPANSRTKAEFISFGRHVFDPSTTSSHKWSPLPTQPSFLMAAVYETQQALQDVWSVVTTRPDIAAVIFAVGLLSGVLLTAIFLVVCVDARVASATARSTSVSGARKLKAA